MGKVMKRIISMVLALVMFSTVGAEVGIAALAATETTETASAAEEVTAAAEEEESAAAECKTHTWDAGKTTTAATCAKKGVKTYTCTVCGATKTESIAKKAHTWEVSKKASATNKTNGKFKCSVCGATKTLYYPKVTLSKTQYTYSGKAKKPTVTVKDSNGSKVASKYYKVTYVSYDTGKKVSSMKNVGKYYVKVTFNTRYSGSVQKAVKISPKSTSVKTVSVCGNGFTVKYGKITSCTTGYQVQYSTSKSFKNATTKTVKDNTKTSKSILDLKSKQVYYVRVRTYKKVSGNTYRSAWSKAVKVTTGKGGKFTTKSGKTYYKYDDGTKAKKKTVKTADGKSYYFDSNGVMATGWMKRNGEYYYYDRDTGVQKTNCTKDGIKIRKDGTAVQTEFSVSKMDTMITARKTVDEVVSYKDTKEQKLKKIFDWVLKHPYKRYRKLRIARSSDTWMMTFANDIFEKGRGCCVSEASAFSFMVKEIGYQPYICDDTGHAWTEIDGKVYDTLFAESKNYSRYYAGNYKSAGVHLVNKTKI